MASREPTGWEQYYRGFSEGRSDSMGSLGRHRGSFEDGEDQDPYGHDPEQAVWSGRRSSVTNRLAAITDLGGVNSIRSFTRSWQRAAAFPEVIPNRPSFVFAPDQEPLAAEPTSFPRTEITPDARTSLLRGQFEGTASENAISDADSELPESEGATPPPLHGRESERKRLGNDLSRIYSGGGSVRSNSIFEVPPHLAAPPIIGSYSSYRSYGTVGSGISRASMLQAGDLWRQQQEARGEVPDGELPPILVKEVEQDGKFMLAVEGQSTLPQTVVNSTNVLIGVGLLSLPIGIRYAGWICGLVSLVLCAMMTGWTARLLAKCMDLDPTLITFSDVAYISFGKRARVIVSILFTVELLAACVALVVLFADSLDLLFPGALSVTGWKVVCMLILIPFQFAPLRILSYTSFVGILSVLAIIVIVVLDGLLKPHTPGSLTEPAKTYLLPANWLTLPLSFGLLMSPWGGHSVFPNIYRDMRHPHKYKEAVRITFSFTLFLDAAVAIFGILMFGDCVSDELTSSILETSGYPQILNILLVIFIAIIPLTKIPLNAQPIVTTLELLAGLRNQVVADESSMVGMSSSFRGFMKVVIRIAILLVFLVIAILFPAFESIMAFMGSALCFTICVTLPLAFYLKLFGHEIGLQTRILTWCAMTLSLAISIIGTVWAFLPKSLIGAGNPPAPDVPY